MNERVDSFRRVRRERLLGLLPRVYAGERGTAIWCLLDALAGHLALLDDATERVLRDRWLRHAGGDPPWDADTHPLERLGALVSIAREPFETEAGYRNRLTCSAPALLAGPTSVRGILGLAAAALGTELCPHVSRDLDSVEACGVRPGTTEFCPGCRDPSAARCWFDGAPRKRDTIRVRLRMTDNPVSPRATTVSALTHDQKFIVRDTSLAEDRPTLTLTARDHLVRYPAVQNMRTREVTLYAGTLAPGQSLVIEPRRAAEEVEPFRTADRVGPMVARPDGCAYILAGESITDVTDKIFYLRGESFDSARFAGDDAARRPRFAELTRSCRTPSLAAGETPWRYAGYTKADVDALADEVRNALIDPPLVPTPGDAPAVDLQLTWWTRPPAQFRLQVPFMPDVRADTDHRDEILALLRRTLDHARAAGVRASLELPAPPHHDLHLIAEHPPLFHPAAAFAEPAAPAERPMTSLVAATFGDEHIVADGQFAFRGVFDVTRFDGSTAAP